MTLIKADCDQGWCIGPSWPWLCLVGAEGMGAAGGWVAVVSRHTNNQRETCCDLPVSQLQEELE